MTLKSDARRRDIAGIKFGRITPIENVGKSSKGSMWRCRCDCGGEITERIDSITTGNTSSCGCIRAEAIAASNRVDIRGDRFGKLVAIEPVGSDSVSNVLWRCTCDCGGEKITTAAKLRNGKPISCGCVVRSTLPPLSPEKLRAQAAVWGNRRRARITGAGGSFTAAQIDELYQKQRGRCAGPGCGVKLGSNFHRDHREAISRGGSNDITNIELLCPACNHQKHAKDPIDWAQSLGRLL